MSKHNPVILITGASRGLGRGIAVECAKSGFSVSINYAGNEKAAIETQKLCEENKINSEQKFIPIQGDISSSDSRKNLVKGTIDNFGHLDALVNNAGIAPKVRNDITEADESSFDDMINTNLKGPYFLTQNVANHWLKDKPECGISSGFKIIYITSISSHTASVARGDYCISKAGLSMSVQLWATRLAEENIQVYELRPGIMKTDMTSGVTAKYDALIDEGLVPQKRWGTSEDLGLGVASLLKGAFPFSTGTVIDVDGGFQLRRL
jgi:3-oxoacyl-[acyl-carrier protein] reductase